MLTTVHARLLWAACAAAVLIGSAAAAIDSTSAASKRDRDRLQHQVNEFVAGVAVNAAPAESSIARWSGNPVCPLVAGVPKAQGEYVLSRLSAISRQAGAPLAGENCAPTLFVIVSADSQKLLASWAKRHPGQFGGDDAAAMRRFAFTPKPVRVWYNVGGTRIDGMSLISPRETTLGPGRPAAGAAESPAPPATSADSGRDILSAIVVVDLRGVSGVSFGQMTDYVGVVGLARINLDSTLRDDAPTILHLFDSSQELRAREMTLWDKALLHALYQSPGHEPVAVSQMQTLALNEIAATAAR